MLNMWESKRKTETDLFLKVSSWLVHQLFFYVVKKKAPLRNTHFGILKVQAYSLGFFQHSFLLGVSIKFNVFYSRQEL